MRVKIAQLKTHLSKYVQSLRDGGEPIEVCVRDQTVAYLTRPGDRQHLDSREQNDLAKRLERRGLHLQQRGRVSTRILTPGEPGDGRDVENTILAIRSQKDW